MSTPFIDVYGYFMPKITDYDFVKYTQDQLEDELETRLNSACVRFKSCKKINSKDNILKVFTEDLTEEEKEIIATLMVIEWLNPKIYSIELIKQNLSTKDFQMYSQANHLKELRDLREMMKKEATHLMSRYSYSKL